MEVFEITKRFPSDERFSMTDQVRRSTRSVASNIAEAWRKRRYKAAFISKLSDAESEGAETQTWIELAARSKYIAPAAARRLDAQCEAILGQLVTMIRDANRWCRLASDG